MQPLTIPQPQPLDTADVAAVGVLLVDSRTAARMLAISERTLWTLAHTGSIPRVKVGASVRYDVEDLRRLVASQKSRTQRVAAWRPAEHGYPPG